MNDAGGQMMEGRLVSRMIERMNAERSDSVGLDIRRPKNIVNTVIHAKVTLLGCSGWSRPSVAICLSISFGRQIPNATVCLDTDISSIRHERPIANVTFYLRIHTTSTHHRRDKCEKLNKIVARRAR